MKLKHYRMIAGYTQKDIAELLGIKQNSYSMKESGKRKFTIEEIAKLKDILKLETDVLIRSIKGE